MKTRHSAPLMIYSVYIQVGTDGLRVKTFGLRQYRSILGNQIMSAENKVLRGLPVSAEAYTYPAINRALADFTSISR